MPGLVVKLAPNERILVNGAVVENGDRRARLSIVTPDAHILRLRDAIHPSDANTPVKRLCYGLQLILSGDSDGTAMEAELLQAIERLSRILTDADSRRQLDIAGHAIREGGHYGALKAVRNLIGREARLLALKTK